ncbi:hypothetical protein V1226_07515 [Lachnospiraceae bacterium JLR.KK009]
MKDKTLVYMTFRDGTVSLRTVSRSRKSPHRFYIPCQELEGLETGSTILVQDIYSFAKLRRDAYAGTVEAAFTWLEGNGNGVSGYQETITLPYGRMMECLHESKPFVWKTLSIDNSAKQAQIVFKSRKNLHAALANGVIRRKLIRFLRDQFSLAYAEKIEIYDDFVPYRFFFRETRGGEIGISGGIILHGQEDMKTAYYSMHT